MADSDPKDNQDPFDRESFWTRLRRSRYFFIAVFLHVILIFIFGHRILFEPHQQVILKSNALFAPPSPKKPEQPVNTPTTEEKRVEVKAAPPKEETKKILTTDKLSSSFNVAPPPINPTVSGLTGSAGGSPGGTGDGMGITDVNYGKDEKLISVVFCVDISRSMISGERNFKVIEDELSKQLHRLSEATNVFNVITFAKVDRAYKKDSVVASPGETGSALLWFHKLSPESFKAENWKKDQLDDVVDFHLGSHPHLALEKAFQERPNLIVLLSDGNPTDISRKDVEDRIKKLQESSGRPVTINTVLFETASEGEENHRARQFMELVAKDTGGTFSSVKHPKKE